MPISCDECYIDISGIICEGYDEYIINQYITNLRHVIKEQIGLNVTIGVGPSLIIARSATKLAKPNGQLYLS